MADLEGQISTLESEKGALQIELASSKEELDAAREDIKKLAETVSETQSLYQHELMQHGKSMEGLFAAKEQVRSILYTAMLLLILAILACICLIHVNLKLKLYCSLSVTPLSVKCNVIIISPISNA